MAARLTRPGKRFTQPQGPVPLDRNNPLGAKVFAHFPLRAGFNRTIGSSAETVTTTLGYSATSKGSALNGTGSAGATAVLDLSTVGKRITVACWFYWSAYANTDNFLMEYSANANTSNVGCFNVDPNEASGFFAVGYSNGTGGGYWVQKCVRPTAGAWHRLLFSFDIGLAAAISAIYIDGVSQTLTAGTQNYAGLDAAFGNVPLYLLSRGNASLFGTGQIQDLTFYRGVFTAAEAAADAANPYQIFEPRAVPPYVSGGTTAALTGVTGTGTTGTVTAAQNKALTGNSAAGSAGTSVASIVAALTGTSGSTSVGSVTALVNKALTATTATGGAGAPSVGSVVSTTGTTATGSAGTVAPSTGATAALTGVSSGGTAGSASVNSATALTGLSATGSAGTVSPSTGSTAALTGTTSTGSAGALTSSGSATVTGITSTGTAGTSVAIVSPALTGTTGTGAAGTTTSARSAALTATSGAGTAGTASNSSTVTPSGLTATGGAGTVTASTGATVALTAVTGSGTVGATPVSSTAALSGLTATGSVGTVSASTGAVAALSGVSSSGLVGAVGQNVTIALSGVSVAGSVGTLTPSQGVTVSLSGVGTVGSIGSIGAAYIASLTGSSAGGFTGAVSTGAPAVDGGAGEYPKKKKYVVKVGDKLVQFSDIRMAMELANEPEIKVPIKAIKAKAKVHKVEAVVKEVLKQKDYAQALRLYEDMQDEEDIEMLLLSL